VQKKHTRTIFLIVHLSEKEESVVHMWGETPDISPRQKYKHKIPHILTKIQTSPAEGN
jgi:hypothetical protein